MNLEEIREDRALVAQLYTNNCRANVGSSRLQFLAKLLKWLNILEDRTQELARTRKNLREADALCDKLEQLLDAERRKVAELCQTQHQ